MLDPDVLPANTGPSRRVQPDVQMKESLVIDPNTTVKESWNQQGKLKHLLQRQPRNRHVGCHPARMLAVIHAADLLIVRGTAVAIMNDNRPFSLRPEQFQGVNESGLDLQSAAAMAGEFRFRKMLA